MAEKENIAAIIYDFDKTLTDQDMQNYSFIPALGMTPSEFWRKTGEFSAETGVERILSYMYMMVNEAKEKGIELTREYLYSLGKDLEYFKGVLTWFKRINDYGREKGVKIEHYLISSGTKEIIDGSVVAHEFTQIFGCEFYFDPVTNVPIWPKLAINYTAKTQFYFRITKGIKDIIDDNAVNRKQTHLRIPRQNVIYIGDGMTDVPIMLLVRQNGGHSIAVYPEGERKIVQHLYDEGRVNFVCPADYTEGSNIDTVVKLVIDGIRLSSEIEKTSLE